MAKIIGGGGEFVASETICTKKVAESTIILLPGATIWVTSVAANYIICSSDMKNPGKSLMIVRTMLENQKPILNRSPT